MGLGWYSSGHTLIRWIVDHIMARSFLLFLILMGLWLLMSGHHSPLLISLGAVSSGFAAWMSHRLGGSDAEGLPLHLFLRLPFYLLWLFKEIIVSNIATGKLILTKGEKAELFYFPITQRSGAGIATHANSITLTPGTVTVDIDEHGFIIHALSPKFGDGIRSGILDQKVTALEGPQKDDPTEENAKGDAR